MEKVFICGHKNPDTDSIASAVSYAYLKSKICQDYDYVPIRCGNVSSQTKFIFENAGVTLPEYMKDMYPKVKDNMSTSVIAVKTWDPISKFLRLIKEVNLRNMPVVEDEDNYKGMLGVNDISDFFIRDYREGKPVFYLTAGNLIRSLRAKVLHEGNRSSFEASIFVATMAYDEFHDRSDGFNDENSILITGNRLNILEYAFKKNYPAIVLVGFNDDELKKLDFKDFKGWIFVSPYDSSQTIRCVEMATPISKVMTEVDTVSPDDYIDTVAQIISKSGSKTVPVISDGKLLGVITGSDLLKRKRARLILMDHNEPSQAIDGAESAEIMEIIDHHRLGTIKTNNPITFCARPVGSTCTLVYSLFKSNGITIPKEYGLLLLGGILSDTVIMKSPTTTEEDVFSIRELGELCGVDPKEYGVQIFSATDGLETRTVESILGTDFKIFEEYGIRFGISQAETVTLEKVDLIKDSLVKELSIIKEQNSLDWSMLLLTDIIKEESILISTDFESGEKLFSYKKLEDHIFALPGVLSRKKQLLPEVLKVLEELSR